MDHVTLSLAVGAVAGALVAIPMIFQRSSARSCFSAFFVYLFAAVLVFHGRLPYLPWWAQGMAVVMMLTVPLLFAFSGKERKAIPVVVFNALLFRFPDLGGGALSLKRPKSNGRNFFSEGSARSILPDSRLFRPPQRRIGENMPRKPDGEQQQPRLRPPPRTHDSEDAVEQRRPDQRDGDDLRTQRNGAVLPEIADVGAQAGMCQQPVVQPRRRAAEGPRRQQQKRRGGQQRHEDSDDSQHEHRPPEQDAARPREAGAARRFGRTWNTRRNSRRFHAVKITLLSIRSYLCRGRTAVRIRESAPRQIRKQVCFCARLARLCGGRASAR